MNSICGLFHRKDHALPLSQIPVMARALLWSGAHRAWQEGPAGIAQRTGEPRFDLQAGLVVAGAGRVDNRPELERALGISASDAQPLDINDLFLRAYRQWGEECCARIYGDWTFAAWHTREQRLFLARDHYGITSVYYYCDARVFAFASDVKALLALNLCPVEMDEEYLAQVLVAQAARQGERTIYRSIHRLPPAHCLTVERERVQTRRYWRLEATPELDLKRRQDYVEAFQEVFDAAVNDRLAPVEATGSTGGPGQIAVALSGGLDSSAVASTAALLLHRRGESLTAFTSVPLSDTRAYLMAGFGDEFPLAQAVSRRAGNMELCRVEGGTVSPIEALRCMLGVLGEPGHAAGNFYWMLEMQRAAQARGCRVLLTGQAGNASVSWRGSILSQPLALQWGRLGARRWAMERLKRAVPPRWIGDRRRRRMDADAWYRRSAIHPDFARRLGIFEQWLTDPAEAPARTAREQRLRFLEPARGTGGAKQAQMGAAHDLEFRDPTADARVLAFTIAVPDHIFIDPKTGMDRWLIRAAMSGRVPDETLLNRQRGVQAADLVPRLRACAGEVEAALAEIEAGPASRCVDTAYMRAVWKRIQEQDTPTSLLQANSILTRGVMAGLFVNGFYA